MPLLPNIVKPGEAPLVEITFLVSPLAQVASILMSSPAPVGMFLICKAAITEPPHLVSGCPLISDKLVGAAPARPVAPAGVARVFRVLYEPLTSWAAAEIWNRPQA